MINFNDVNSLSIEEGNVSKITQNGIILWQRLSKIQFVRSYGLEYIDTGIVPDADTKVVLDFELEDINNPAALFGACNTDMTKQYYFAWNGLEYVSGYGGQNLNTWGTTNPYTRQTVEMDGAATTYESDTKEYEVEKFVVPETLKLFANCQNAPIVYEWYRGSNTTPLKNENTEDLDFVGITEEQDIFYVAAYNAEDPNKEKGFSSRCVVSIEDKSLLAGKKYTHNATENNWYYNHNSTGKPNEFDYNGEFLTDGNIYNDYWEDKYFGVKNFDPVIEFNLDNDIYFKELQIYAHADNDPENASAGVRPPKVTISIGSDTVIFEGEMTDSDLVLVSDQPISTNYLKFSFVRNGNFCLIDEIRAFTEPTGLIPDGSMKPRHEANIIRGKLPNAALSSLPKGMASGSTTNYGVLTDGVVSTNSDSYRKNITFYDDSVTFCYDVSEFVTAIKIYSHTPTDLNNSGIDTITIQGYDAYGSTFDIATGSVDDQGVYEYIFDDSTFLERVFITMTRRKNVGADWNGISLSEIQILRHVTDYFYSEPPFFDQEEPSEDVTEEPVAMFAIQKPATSTGLTPRFVLNLDKQKTAQVLDKFTLTAVAVADNNTITDKAQCKIYSCKIYKKDVLVRDFVPALNSKGEAGLYDNVEKVFYENQGEGAFGFER